jgi:hypothetical protein
MRENDLTNYEREILQNIDEDGWHSTSVVDPHGNEPTFSYSVGFTRTLACPEFIVIGLGPKLMHSMLWETFRQIRGGKPPEEGAHWTGLLEGFHCISRVVHPTNVIRDWFNSAVWFWSRIERRDGPLNAMQMVWPSRDSGKFPWETDCAQAVRDLQPPLWLPNRALS